MFARVRQVVRAVTGADAVERSRLSRVASGVADDVAALTDALAELQRRSAALRAAIVPLEDWHRQDLERRAALGALPEARLAADRLVLHGVPSLRSGIGRRPIGVAVERPLQPSIGKTRCATAAADVRALWERLIEVEAAAEPSLRGMPARVLEMTDAVVARDGRGRLEISLGADALPGMAEREVAIPRCTYDFPERKLRNLGHWLLDCVPQIAALAARAPRARLLVPRLPGEVHRSMLDMVGVSRSRLLEWEGSPLACGRLLVMESEGRLARGRPLSLLLEMREQLAGPPQQAVRRLYVSRRDARSGRQWITNEAKVEALFVRRGFDVLVMAGCSPAEQLRLFQTARVVAGISGAGLADMVFAPDGAHVIALLSDSLMHWYAADGGSRAGWADPAALPPGGPLSMLSDSPRFYAHLAAACRQRAHTFVGGDAMPLDDLDRFLDDVLGEVERG